MVCFVCIAGPSCLVHVNHYQVLIIVHLCIASRAPASFLLVRHTPAVVLLLLVWPLSCPAGPPPKPWERAGATISTADPSAPKPWEQAQPGDSAACCPTSTGTTAAARPWERQGVTSNGYASTSAPYGNNTYGSNYGNSYGSTYGTTGYGAGTYGSSSYASPYASRYGAQGGLYGSSYGSGLYGGGMYGSSGMYGSTGGMYGSGGMYGGGGMYGSSMYGGAGGGMYGSSMYGTGGMYGGGMGGGFMRPGGMTGGPGAGPFDPNQPPPAPPTAWQALLAGINGVMMFFGRLSFLVDENAHAVHFFISALLQLLDRAGSLYGEIARFILRVVFRRKRKPPGLPMPPGVAGKQLALPAPGGAGGGMLALPAPQSAAASPAAGMQLGSRGGWTPPPLPTGQHGSGAGGPWDNLWSDS